jgi:hypothetical protein
VRLEGLRPLKNPTTSLEIEPATSRLEVKCLPHASLSGIRRRMMFPFIQEEVQRGGWLVSLQLSYLCLLFIYEEECDSVCLFTSTPISTKSGLMVGDFPGEVLLHMIEPKPSYLHITPSARKTSRPRKQ